MDIVKTLAYAKLNLTLDITGKTQDYHTLDSFVVTVNLADKIIAKKRKDALVKVKMRGMCSEKLSPEENNAVQAAEAFVRKFKTLGADITIYKEIPMGAGLGGSSADAAGVINALAKMYGVTDFNQLKELADEFGSDTGYLLRGGLARLKGRGNEVEFLPDTPEMHFIVIAPRSGVSTSECYAAYDALPARESGNYSQRWFEALRSEGVTAAAPLFGNDLYEGANALNGDVGTALTAVKGFSPVGASMTGSGSSAFGLFATRALCGWAKSSYKGKFGAYALDAIYPANKK